MRHLLALGPVKLAGAAHLLQFLLELDDLFLQQPAVGFDLGFTRTTHEACTTTLTFQVGPAANQPALLIVQMRKLDLQRAFLGGSTAAEDFQDETGPVDDLAVPFLFQIALLNRGQRMIDDDQTGIVLAEQMS